MNDMGRITRTEEQMRTLINLANIRAERNKDLRLPQRLRESLAVLGTIPRIAIRLQMQRATPEERYALYVDLATRIPEDRLITYAELQRALNRSRIRHTAQALLEAR